MNADFKDIPKDGSISRISDIGDNFDSEENSENLLLSAYGYYHF